MDNGFTEYNLDVDPGPTDNTGRHFILAFLSNINHPASDTLLDAKRFISTSSPNDVSVRVTSPASSNPSIDEAFTVTAGACSDAILSYNHVRVYFRFISSRHY